MRNSMIALVVALATVLAVPATNALARGHGGGGHGGGGHGGWHGGGWHGGGGHGGHFAFRRGFVRHRFVAGGYGYGYSCWRWRLTPVGYRRVWVCGPYY